MIPFIRKVQKRQVHWKINVSLGNREEGSKVTTNPTRALLGKNALTQIFTHSRSTRLPSLNGWVLWFVNYKLKKLLKMKVKREELGWQRRRKRNHCCPSMWGGITARQSVPKNQTLPELLNRKGVQSFCTYYNLSIPSALSSGRSQNEEQYPGHWHF